MLLVCAVAGILVATPWSSAWAAEDTEEPKAIKTEHDNSQQVEDTDKPKDKSLLSRQPADDAVAKKNAEDNAAFYEKWQFWAVAGGVVVVAAAAAYGSYVLYHSLNGGDVRPCNPMFVSCIGEGR